MTIQLNYAGTWIPLNSITTAEVEGCVATICRIIVPPRSHQLGSFRWKNVPDVSFHLNPFVQQIGNELELVFFGTEELEINNLELEIISW